MQLYLYKFSILGLLLGALFFEREPSQSTSVPKTVAHWDEPPITIPEFIDQSVNFIEYPEHLAVFKAVLDSLKLGLRDRVRIVHIGDSHLQAGFFSGKLQRLLCARYGCAGRGLVFPHQLAKSNACRDVRAESNAVWEKQSCVSGSHSLPVGLSGLTLRCSDASFCLRLGLNRNLSPEFGFDRAWFWGDNLSGADWLPGWQAARQSACTPLSGSRCLLRSDTLLHELTLFGNASAGSSKPFVLQGIVLENSKQAGILYHAIGVNGATFAAYNRSIDFVRQVADLQPDLIVVSLGTNEAVDPNFNPAGLEKQADKLLNALRPLGAALLLTTPNDLRFKGTVTAYPGQAAEALLRKALEHKAAAWDFYILMGGKGSIRTWQQQGLAASDGVHLTAAGYQVQAQLLFDAIARL